MQNISAHSIGRKPPHHQSPPGRSQDALPRPRSFEAERVRRERQRLGVYITKAVHEHLRRLPSQIPVGTTDRPVRGGWTAAETIAAVDRAITGGWGVHEGTAVGLLDELRRRGWLLLLATPRPLTAGATHSMLAKLTPLVERVSHGRYRIHAGRPSDLSPRILETLVEALPGDASAAPDGGDCAVDGQQRDASAYAATAAPLSGLETPCRERARGDLQEGPSSASDGEQLWLEHDYMGAAAGSIFAPAEGDEARPATPPARATIERGASSWTRSGWMQAVPLRPQLQRAAALALAHLTADGIEGTASSVAAILSGYEVKATARSRASLARALQALSRRGLLLVTGGRWTVPAFTVNPALELFDVAEAPDAREPSPDLLASLGRWGVDGEGLSHEEAVGVNRRLWSRRKDDRPHPRLLAAVQREQERADLPVDLRALGRLDVAAARRALARAMGHRRGSEMLEAAGQ